jgi:hypothetical protein
VAEVTVDAGGDGASTTAELSAHEAAVAEGATAVNAALAVEAAGEAKDAAELALAAAQANVETGLAVADGVQSAQASADVATVSAQMVHEALTAQTAAISALTEELKASRKSARPAPDGGGGRPEPDHEPESRGPRLVRR